MRERVQTNGRCESANDRGDTYGPITYIAYVPGYLAFGWSGKWDELPAAHFTALLFDSLTLIGLALVGWRFGRAGSPPRWPSRGPRTPSRSTCRARTRTTPCSRALLVFGFWLVDVRAGTGPVRRPRLLGEVRRAAPAPLWATYPDGLRRHARPCSSALGFCRRTALGFWVLLLEPDPLHAARDFWDRTFSRSSWSGLTVLHLGLGGVPGYPDLHAVQTVLKAMLVVAVLGSAFCLAARPRSSLPL